MVEAAGACSEPLGVDARPGERLDQLQFGRTAVEREPHREDFRRAADRQFLNAVPPEHVKPPVVGRATAHM